MSLVAVSGCEYPQETNNTAHLCRCTSPQVDRDLHVQREQFRPSPAFVAYSVSARRAHRRQVVLHGLSAAAAASPAEQGVRFLSSLAASSGSWTFRAFFITPEPKQTASRGKPVGRVEDPLGRANL